MAMTKILLDCTDQNLIVTEAPVIASGGINDNMLVINFSAEWSNLAKSAIFFTSNYKTIYEAVLTNGECTIPAEVLTEAATLYIGVRGYNSDDVLVKPSTLVKFKIVPGAPPADGTTVEPTANVYQQLLTAYGKTDNALAKEVAEREREVAVERSRIDALVRLENGSTTGDAELQDIRIGADGETYESAGTAVREQFTNCAKLTHGKNLYDKSNAVEGYYVAYYDGTIGANANYEYFVTDCEPNTTYCIKQTFSDGIGYNLHVAFFAETFDLQNFISGAHTQSTFTTPENATVMVISVKIVDGNSLQIEKGTIPTLYEKYEKKVQFESLGSNVKNRLGKNVVHVGTEASVDYEYDSLLEALINNPTNTIIYLHDGVHSVLRMYERYYGEDYFSNYAGYANNNDDMDKGLFLGDGVEIIGVGNAIIDFSYDGDNEAVKKYFSVISTSQNNTIDNITIRIPEIQNCRYLIHDDFSETLIGGGTNHFKNIIFDGYTYLGTCIGGGMGKKNTYIIENCLFMNLGQSIAISYHNCISDSANKLIVKDNYCDGSIKILHYGVSELNTTSAIIANNHCTKIVTAYTDETNYPNANIQVFTWNNEETQNN